MVDDVAAGFVSAAIDSETAETFSVVALLWQRRGVGLAARRSALHQLRDRGVTVAVSASRPHSASSRISQRIGYRRVGTESRLSQDGTSVYLERWELELRTWSDAD
jgi:L-amino acid N-acyltransferase YncA